MKITQNGSVMVEALVGIALFSIGMVGLLSSLGVSTTLSTDSRYRTEAITLADELFGEMEASDDYNKSSERFAAWKKNRVRGLLPNGNAEIDFIPGTRAHSTGANTFVTLTITWKAPSDKASDPGGKFVTSTYLY
ncbi:MAG: hypothetical protein LBE32_06540 [Burkholderiales bacterium]|jgi:Tfp pilus assembly protein PilV|nr:hypothetical protein [Burkholderiales bacterium]